MNPTDFDLAVRKLLDEEERKNELRGPSEAFRKAVRLLDEALLILFDDQETPNGALVAFSDAFAGVIAQRFPAVPEAAEETP